MVTIEGICIHCCLLQITLPASRSNTAVAAMPQLDDPTRLAPPSHDADVPDEDLSQSAPLLSKLPAELRVEIWRLALGLDGPEALRWNRRHRADCLMRKYGGLQLPSAYPTGMPLPRTRPFGTFAVKQDYEVAIADCRRRCGRHQCIFLLLACRQICDEAVETLCWKKTFCFTGGGDLAARISR